MCERGLARRSKIGRDTLQICPVSVRFLGPSCTARVNVSTLQCPFPFVGYLTHQSTSLLHDFCAHSSVEEMDNLDVS